MDKKQDNGQEQSSIDIENSKEALVEQVVESPQLLERVLDTPNAQFMIAQRSHSGPLPAPEDLSKYDSIIPNGAERIMQMAEKEQSFRHQRINTDNDASNSALKRGQYFGILSVLGVLALSAYLAYIGHPASATTVATVVVAAVAGVFVTGRFSDKKENEPGPDI